MEWLEGTSSACCRSAEHESTALPLQGLVGNWQSLVSNLTSIMDYAAGTSGQQTEANQAVFRVTQESLAAIQDATQLAQRLQEQYAEQELLLTAGNDSLQCSCNRSATLYIHFNVTGWVCCLCISR